MQEPCFTVLLLSAVFDGWWRGRLGLRQGCRLEGFRVEHRSWEARAALEERGDFNLGHIAKGLADSSGVLRMDPRCRPWHFFPCLRETKSKGFWVC